jgi:hypothetical protein
MPDVMTTRTLTLRELNRATLARQLLSERASLSVAEDIEQVVSLQAQSVSAPFVALWTRLQDFRRDESDEPQAVRPSLHSKEGT